MSWTFVTAGTEMQPARIDGVNVRDHEWRQTGQMAQVTDPLYGQSFTFQVWAVSSKGRSIRFAAGEFSNGVWGFYRETP